MGDVVSILAKGKIVNSAVKLNFVFGNYMQFTVLEKSFLLARTLQFPLVQHHQS